MSAAREYQNLDGVMSHDQIAECMGISRQYSQRIEQTAIRKCQEWCRERGLRLEDLLPIKFLDRGWRGWH